MYKLSPICDIGELNEIELPSCMYQLRSIYEDTSSERNKSNCMESFDKVQVENYSRELLKLKILVKEENEINIAKALTDLLSRQKITLSRLEMLEWDIAKLSNRSDRNKEGDEQMMTLTRYPISKRSLQALKIKDIVIFLHPNDIPYSIIALLKLIIKANVRVTVNIYRHSSLSSLGDEQFSKEVEEIHSFLSKNDSNLLRVEYNLIVTLIFKDIIEPALIVSPIRNLCITGESNILRYLIRAASCFNSLFAKLYEDRDIIALTLLDHYLDSEMNTETLKNLKPKSYLLDGCLTIADLRLWGKLAKTKNLVENLQQWFMFIRHEVFL